MVKAGGVYEEGHEGTREQEGITVKIAFNNLIYAEGTTLAQAGRLRQTPEPTGKHDISPAR